MNDRFYLFYYLFEQHSDGHNGTLCGSKSYWANGILFGHSTSDKVRLCILYSNSGLRVFLSDLQKLCSYFFTFLAFTYHLYFWSPDLSTITFETLKQSMPLFHPHGCLTHITQERERENTEQKGYETV